MAVQRDPVLKRCRYLGISPAVVGINKESKMNPNANSRRKVSEYGLQLKEKQKLKFIYGVLEKQFYHYYEIASKMEGQAGNNLIVCLESRLDNVVFRMGLALTRREARQLVNHGHFLVNGKRVDIPSYRIKVGDVISLRVPLWLEVNKDEFSAKVTRMPNIEDLDYDVEAHLIVELYSK